jgi:hypothetical protein
MPEHFKVRVWAILGDGQTGKSTIIGHLISQLGMGSGGFRWVPLRGGGFLQVYARRQSLQEAKRSPDQVIKDTKLKGRSLEKSHHISINWLNLLVAIRTDTTNRLPQADEYLSHFVRAGWTIESLVLLGEYDEQRYSMYSAFGVPICEIYDSKETARDKKKHHWLVGPVRNHFGWA